MDTPLDNFALLVDKEFGEVPLQVARQEAALLALQEAKDWVRCTPQSAPN